MAAGHVSVPKSFSDGDAGEWFQRFEICAAANQWYGAKKALKLPTLLEGEALAIWLEFLTEQKADCGCQRTVDCKNGANGVCLPRRISLPEIETRGGHYAISL